MKSFTSLIVSAIVTTGLLAGCAPKPKPDPRQLDESQVRVLADAGANQFGIQWGKPLNGAGERGVAAVTDGVTTFTTHTGSRVFIVHNRKEFPPTADNGFQGTDEELKDIGLKFLKAAGANADEIARARVLTQFTQLGEKSADGKSVRVDAPQKSHRALLVTRHIGGVEAPSSRMLLYVGASGRIGFMELNWPDISRDVVDRASQLRKSVEAGFAAPRLEGAEVESVQPVLLNSPAAGFYNDSVAAIRVIYSNNNKELGRKAVRYLDERGADVVLPRDIDRLREEAVARKGAKQAG